MSKRKKTLGKLEALLADWVLSEAKAANLKEGGGENQNQKRKSQPSDEEKEKRLRAKFFGKK